MKSDFLSNNINKLLFALAIIAVVVAIVAFASYRITFPGSIAQEHVVWGEFGDFIGGVLNPIFAFFAFLALLITIIIQNRELSISSAELEKSAKALQEQSDSLRKQNFENTFFQMVRLHNDIVNDMYIAGGPGSGFNELRGRECFRVHREIYNFHYERAIKTHIEQGPLAVIENAYDGFFKERQAAIGHYFRNLYTIIKYVDDGDVEDKKSYTNIIKAQLSSYELYLLFYNCLWHVGKKKFYSLVVKYELLENMSVDLLVNSKEKLDLYAKKAYGDLEFS